jgi:DNA-binding transcriptional ArsR family regulator
LSENAEKISKFLEDNKVSLTEVAKQLDKSRTTVYSWLDDFSKNNLIEQAVSDILKKRKYELDRLVQGNIDSPHGTNITGNKNKIARTEDSLLYKVIDEQNKIIEHLKEQVEFYRAKCKG